MNNPSPSQGGDSKNEPTERRILVANNLQFFFNFSWHFFIGVIQLGGSPPLGGGIAVEWAGAWLSLNHDLRKKLLRNISKRIQFSE